MHLDPNIALDFGLFTILAVQIELTIDLAINTLSRYLGPTTRPDLVPFANALLNGYIIGLYLLSESGHFLDDFNIENTVHQHWKEDGSYILKTPNDEVTEYVQILTGSLPDSCQPRIQPPVTTRSRLSWLA